MSGSLAIAGAELVSLPIENPPERALGCEVQQFAFYDPDHGMEKMRYAFISGEFTFEKLARYYDGSAERWRRKGDTFLWGFLDDSEAEDYPASEDNVAFTRSCWWRPDFDTALFDSEVVRCRKAVHLYLTCEVGRSLSSTRHHADA